MMGFRMRPPKDRLTHGPYAGQWYVCRWCRKARAVGKLYPCPTMRNVPSNVPWGVSCEPDGEGVRV